LDAQIAEWSLIKYQAPTREAFYGGLYLRPFVVKGYGSSEDAICRNVFNHAVVMNMDETICRQRQHGVDGFQLAKASDYYARPVGSLEIDLMDLGMNPLKGLHPSFLGPAKNEKDWSVAFI
jgi:hypothetical protein